MEKILCDKNKRNVRFSSCNNKQFSYYWIKVFITKYISNHIIKYNEYFSFLFRLHSSIFLKISFIWFEYSIKAFESFKYFKPVICLLSMNNWNLALYGSFAYKLILSISDSWSNRSSNAFVFQCHESPTNKILCIWSWSSGKFWSCSFMSFFANIIKVQHFLLCF